MGFKFTATALIALGLTFAPAMVRGEAPPFLPVQGYLTDADGNAIDGAAVLQLSLYDGEAAGTALFTEPRSVEVDEGFFAVYLGEVTTLDLDVLRSAPALWLGVSVNNGPELSPRIQLATVPFSVFATYCGEATTLEGAIAADFAEVGHDHGWAELQDIPADLADGDADALGAISCVAGQVPKMGASGWGCAADDNSGGDITSVVAGVGLTGGGTAGDAILATDPTVVQARVSSTCAAGSAIRAITSNGTVTCEPDDVGAPVNHNHGGADITSGLISTNRYDAYDDLYVSGRLDANASSDLLTRTQLDSRYFRLTGGLISGNVSTSGWFQYQPAKSINHMIGPNQFRNVSEADDTWHYQWNWGAGYISGGTSPYTVDLFATVEAPDGSVIRSITCWYRDNHVTSNITGMTFRLLGQTGGYAPTVYATSQTVTTSGRNASIQSRALTTTRTLTTGRDWHIAVSWSVSSIGSLTDGPTFYGCQVAYDFITIRP